MQPEKEWRRKSFKQRLVLKSSLAKETLSEFLGTCIMIVLGCGCVAQAVLSRGHFGGFVTINVGFAMAVVMAIYVTGGVSGGHINPAVSFAMCLFGRMKWFKFPFYVGVPKGLQPIAIGLLIIVLSSSLGLNCGCAMNPARDLSPRLFTALAGWGFDVFRVGNNFWWIPVVAPMVGAAIGGLIYVLLIEIHHPNLNPDFEAEPSEDKLEKHELSVVM
uniref:Aquaporin 9 n=1 Tax=Myotis myotis TaxID=51298 RepID=A0A7J8AH98_MYOMY|nr:aquaporin 9 [Myotis myotis]